jgi:hypothetical protein
MKGQFRLRKPPFYPLNYGDAVKGKVRRMKEKSRGQIYRGQKAQKNKL